MVLHGINSIKTYFLQETLMIKEHTTILRNTRQRVYHLKYLPHVISVFKSLYLILLHNTTYIFQYVTHIAVKILQIVGYFAL